MNYQAHKDCTEIFYCPECRETFSFGDTRWFVAQPVDHHGHLHAQCPNDPEHAELCGEEHEQNCNIETAPED